MNRFLGFPSPFPEFSEEQAIEADSNAYDDLRPLVSAGAPTGTAIYPPGYVVGQDLPAGTYTIKCAEDGTSMDTHLVNDACGVEMMRICPPTTLRIRGWTTFRCPRVRCCS